MVFNLLSESFYAIGNDSAGGDHSEQGAFGGVSIENECGGELSKIGGNESIELGEASSNNGEQGAIGGVGEENECSGEPNEIGRNESIEIEIKMKNGNSIELRAAGGSQNDEKDEIGGTNEIAKKGAVGDNTDQNETCGEQFIKELVDWSDILLIDDDKKWEKLTDNLEDSGKVEELVNQNTMIRASKILFNLN